MGHQSQGGSFRDNQTPCHGTDVEKDLLSYKSLFSKVIMKFKAPHGLLTKLKGEYVLICVQSHHP